MKKLFSLYVLTFLTMYSLYSQANPKFDFPFSTEAIKWAQSYSSPMKSDYPGIDSYKKALDFYNNRQYQKAENLLVDLLMSDSHPDVYYLLGDVLYDTGRYGDAIYPYISAGDSHYYRSDYAWYNASCSVSLYMSNEEDVQRYVIQAREYLYRAFEAGYDHYDHALEDKDLENLRALDTKTNDWIKGYSRIPVKARFLVGFYYVAPTMTSDGMGKRYYIYPDGTYEYYYPESYEIEETSLLSQHGQWTAIVKNDQSIDLRLTPLKAYFGSGAIIDSEEPVQIYKNIQKGSYDDILTISAKGLGTLYRRSIDPEDYAHQKTR
ncbi:tetratricopeptide repeat protein [Spirochaeta cellobiosiphila]|uniref:tetratricopeptide repeat protein n=1 Tax=Spirochaeta cellobiosiphila TaxID=504483 RepID=UPI0004118AB1|nr:tetratricopeptide repeat protein [Spirochaeta cellobiosiphila]